MDLDSQTPMSTHDAILEFEGRVRALPFQPFQLAEPQSWTQAPIPSFVEERRNGLEHFLSVAFSYVPSATPVGSSDSFATSDNLGAFGSDRSVLWEAVRTSWGPTGCEPHLHDELTQHVRHILRNRFQAESNSGALALQDTVVEVDAVEYPGVEAANEPLVYGIGAVIEGVLLTAVVPRSLLAGVPMIFTRRSAS